jgi:hypothetical protein
MSVGDQAYLDENCLDNILAYVRDAPARGTCKKWAEHIYTSCNLEDTIRLKTLLQAKGSLEFDCFATRELGPDIVETAAFRFEFFSDGKFDLDWYHSYSGDLDGGRRELSGHWSAREKLFICEYTKDLIYGPPAVISFHVPQDLVFAGQVHYEDDHPNSVLFPWKLSKVVLSHGREGSDEELQKYAKHRIPEPRTQDPDEQYVDVDGMRVAVCTDIVEKYPPKSWANLMRFRLQFG